MVMPTSQCGKGVSVCWSLEEVFVRVFMFITVCVQMTWASIQESSTRGFSALISKHDLIEAEALPP